MSSDFKDHFSAHTKQFFCARPNYPTQVFSATSKIGADAISGLGLQYWKQAAVALAKHPHKHSLLTQAWSD